MLTVTTNEYESKTLLAKVLALISDGDINVSLICSTCISENGHCVAYVMQMDKNAVMHRLVSLNEIGWFHIAALCLVRANTSKFRRLTSIQYYFHLRSAFIVNK